MAVETQNDLVLELCCVPGRQEALDEMLVQLELCSKALQAGLGVFYMEGSSPSCALPGRLCAWVKALALHLPQEMSSCSNTLKDLCSLPRSFKHCFRIIWKPNVWRSPGSTLLPRPISWTFWPMPLSRKPSSG